MRKNYERATVTLRRSVRERPMYVRRTASAVVAGQSCRRVVSSEHTLRDQVRNLRLALSDLQIEVSDLGLQFRRD